MTNKRLNAQKSAFKLDEGATGVNLLPTKAKGFTLAEVLITLGIIGVVAAMTIPTLIANTRSQQYRSQFKKTLSTLNQAALMSQAQYDFDFADIDNTCLSENDNPQINKSFCSLFNGTVHGNWHTQNFNFDDIYKGGLSHGSVSPMSSGGSAILDLMDGATIFVWGHDCSQSDPCGGYIDVNGINTKPNKEVKCKNTEETNTLFDYNEQKIKGQTCEVDNSSIGDVFPVYFYDNTVVPATNAAAYVLNTAK